MFCREFSVLKKKNTNSKFTHTSWCNRIIGFSHMKSSVSACPAHYIIQFLINKTAGCEWKSSSSFTSCYTSFQKIFFWSKGFLCLVYSANIFLGFILKLFALPSPNTLSGACDWLSVGIVKIQFCETRWPLWRRAGWLCQGLDVRLKQSTMPLQVKCFWFNWF